MAKMIIEPQAGSNLNWSGHSIDGTFRRKVEVTHYVGNTAVGKATFYGEEVSVYFDDDRNLWVAEMYLKEANRRTQ